MDTGGEGGQRTRTWKTWEHCVVIERDRVIKRELGTHELRRRPNQAVLRPFWARELLRNEAATLAFVEANTTIPVPPCRLYTQDGLLHLESKRIANGVLLEEIDRERRAAAAAAAVDHQMTTFVLPQLRSLRRGYIGSVDHSLPVFPPQRVYDHDRRPWDRILAAAVDAFPLCHNHLGPQNIFVCPDTFRIVGIIDWEFAGFFPPYFELPLWRVFDWGGEQTLYEEANARELGFLGLRPGIWLRRVGRSTGAEHFERVY
ncbi:aminoglycoside phosphotransferase [Schizothecium vesticola]|uniref:Aminoglycoside phosphotransferase n=1 Tax=Schizothecium vesticola TaxID=314040 RepID=A0AA40F1V3_9PEZI|nr:aminoglycoside phosphotransferase [Schizothecium vesticola]